MAQIPIRRNDWHVQALPPANTPIVDGVGRGLAADYGIRADHEELQLRHFDAERKITAIANRMGAMIRLDPGAFADASAVLDQAIAATNLPAGAKAELGAKFRSHLPLWAILGEVDKDPQSALAKLEEGAWTSSAPPEAIHRGIEAAQAELRRQSVESHSRQTQRRHAIGAEIENQIQLGFDEPDARRPLPEDFDESLGLDAAREARLRIHYAQRIGALTKAGLWAKAEELQAQIDDLKPQASDEDYAIRAKAFSQARHTGQQILSQRWQNPGAYLEQDPTLREAFDQGRYETAISAAKRLAASIGMPANISVIAPERAKTIADRINTAPAEDAGGMIDALAAASGRMWPEMRTALLTSGKLDKTLTALTFVSDPASRADLAAAVQFERQSPGILRQSAIKTRDEEYAKKADSHLLQRIAEFTNALRIMGGREADVRIAAVQEAGQLRLYDLILKDAKFGKGGWFNRPTHKSERELANLVYNEIIGQEFYVSQKRPMLIAPRDIVAKLGGESELEDKVTQTLDGARLKFDGASGAPSAPHGAGDYAHAILAREDSPGAARRRLEIHIPPSGDGASAEIGGITKEYHPGEFAKLAALPPDRRYDEAVRYIREWTEPVAKFAADPPTRALLADIAHHRGQTGSADIARLALGMSATGQNWTQELAQDLAKLPTEARLHALGAARETYEEQKISRREQFAKGLRQRFSSALRDSLIMAHDRALFDDRAPIDVVSSPDFSGLIVGRSDRHGHFAPFVNRQGKVLHYSWQEIVEDKTPDKIQPLPF